MENSSDNFVWLQQWYNDQCDGDWEHSYGVTIDNVDNPGWYLKVDLVDTELEDRELEWVRVEGTGRSWFVCSSDGRKFEGSSDPLSLSELVDAFRRFADGAMPGPAGAR